MKNRYLIKSVAVVVLSALILWSCTSTPKSDKDVIYTSIAPVKAIVEAIVGDDFRIEVLVPAGVSPETFDPTPRQYIALNEAQMIFSTGLIDFEGSILSRIDNKRSVINLSQGIDLIAGSCSHNHSHAGSHSHGVDPHIWTSPVELQQMAFNCFEAIDRVYADSLKYRANYEKLQQKLQELDNQVMGTLLASNTKSFVIHHPAYTYYARNYNIEQLSIEDEGKEPSARRIGQIIDRIKEERIHSILCQVSSPKSVVEVVAKDCGAEVVVVDPLAEDIVANILEFTQAITR